MKRMVTWVVLTVLTACLEGRAKVISQPVEYKHEDVALEGYLAYDDGISGKRPGVLVVHEWWGLNDYAKHRAEELAELGYVAFALDMYGKGVVTTDPAEAGKLSGSVKGGSLMRSRAKAGLDVLMRNDRVDVRRVAAIGYCFGGTTVLQLAYSGVDIAGVVSFHGGLQPLPSAEDLRAVKAKVLVLHGADDPFVPQEDVAGFQDAMRRGRIDWQMIFYGNAVHAFTNPGVNKAGIDGAKYNAEADRRSWDHMKMFFDEIFGREEGNTR